MGNNIRVEGGHAWSLKGQCRFCGMTREAFKAQGRPDCQWHTIKAGKRKMAAPASDEKGSAQRSKRSSGQL
jgi:hypothetical protein